METIDLRGVSCPTNFVKAKRSRFLARAATANWDAVIITHAAFRCIPVPAGFEREMIEELAKKIGTQMIHFLPRDNDVQRAEINRKTVIDWAPDCTQADHYRQLANAIDSNEMFVVPEPMHTDELEGLLLTHGVLG